MKSTLLITILFYSLSIYSQSNPEVFLCSIKSEYSGFTIYNMQNISNDKGYDSQPSFMDNNQVLFAGNNGGQTDIALYNITDKTKKWFNLTTEGGEYSPQLIPDGGTKVSAVRLDTNGLQRLYSYEFGSSNSEM